MPLLVVVALLLTQSVAGPTQVTRSSAEQGQHATSRADLVAGLAVLREWDLRRAQAWAAADTVALRALYTPRSEAGRADLRLLGSYTARGVVVRRLVTQVFAVRVLGRGRTLWRLSIFDRVAGGELVRRGRSAAMGSSRPVTRTVEFHRLGGSWRVASVSGSGPALREALR